MAFPMQFEGHMKTSRTTLLAVIAAFFAVSGASAWADEHHWADNQWDSRHHYRRDNYGYYDGDRYSHYILYNGHHGYWDSRGAVRVFINVD
jgi:hypothetical protein